MVKFPHYLDKKHLELRVTYLNEILRDKDLKCSPWNILVQEFNCREIESCFVTPSQVKAELEGIEAKLAARLNIVGDIETIRSKLIYLDKTNQLVEDELVADWHQSLSSYIDYLDNNAYPNDSRAWT